MNQANQIYRASPDEAAQSDFVTLVFDANVLTRLRNPPRGDKNLGELLAYIRSLRPGQADVSILPSVVETVYRKEGQSVAGIADAYREWLNEHFTPYGIAERLFFWDGHGESLEQNVCTVLQRVLINYATINVGNQALKKFSRPLQVVSAVDYFFDLLEERQVPLSSPFYALAVATVIAGNLPGRKALQVASHSPVHRSGSTPPRFHEMIYETSL